MSTTDRIEEFLEAGPYAVVGASADPEKYGNKLLRAYVAQGREVYPINPGSTEIEGLAAYRDLPSLPARVRAVSIVTPPAVTEKVVESAARAGVEYVWMQPGAESPAAVETAERLGLKVIAGGPCFLVETGSS